MKYDAALATFQKEKNLLNLETLMKSWHFYKNKDDARNIQTTQKLHQLLNTTANGNNAISKDCKDWAWVLQQILSVRRKAQRTRQMMKSRRRNIR